MVYWGHETRLSKRQDKVLQGNILKRKGLFRYKVFLYRDFILEQSSLDEMKGI